MGVAMSYEVIDGATFDTTIPGNGLTPLSVSVEGLDSAGKTYFTLMTMPLPIVHVNYSDRDATGFLYEMSPERRARTKLYSFKAPTTKGWTREDGAASLVELSDIAQKELGDGKLKGGTFILDSGSSWWETVQEVHVAPLEEQRIATQLARGQEPKRAGGLTYGPANLIVKGITNWLKNQGAFFAITHQLAQVWDAKGPVPGQWRARQNGQMPYIVDMRLRLSVTCNVCGAPECTAPGHIGRTHWATVSKFGMRTGMIGLQIASPRFSTFYRLYTGRDLPASSGNGGDNGGDAGNGNGSGINGGASPATV